MHTQATQPSRPKARLRPTIQGPHKVYPNRFQRKPLLNRGQSPQHLPINSRHPHQRQDRPLNRPSSQRQELSQPIRPRAMSIKQGHLQPQLTFRLFMRRSQWQAMHRHHAILTPSRQGQQNTLRPQEEQSPTNIRTTLFTRLTSSLRTHQDTNPNTITGRRPNPTLTPKSRPHTTPTRRRRISHTTKRTTDQTRRSRQARITDRQPNIRGPQLTHQQEEPTSKSNHRPTRTSPRRSYKVKQDLLQPINLPMRQNRQRLHQSPKEIFQRRHPPKRSQPQARCTNSRQR